MEKNEEANEGNIPIKNLIAIPAIMATLLVLYFGVSFAVNGKMENDGYANILILPLAAALASALGRVSPSLPFTMSNNRSLQSSGIIILFALLMSFISPVFNNIFIITFLLVGILTVMASHSNYFEESNLLLSTIVGFHLAVSFAANLNFDVGLDIDSQRTLIGMAFISFWLASISTGFTLAMFLRGGLDYSGKSSFFSEIPTFTENKLVVLFSSLVTITFIIPLFQSDNYETLGVVWAAFTSLVIIFYAFCHSERWHVLGSIVAINWFIYTLSHLQEIGNTFYPSVFEGDNFLGAFSWFFITFWLNVGAISLSSRGYFGDISPIREHSQFRVWWNVHRYSILLSLSFIVALILRVAWNIVPAMNAGGTGTWDMTGGSDPWYMKRVVDYILANNSHLVFDADRAYPMGAINPRPPLFSWSLALGGMALSWILESDNTGEVIWWSLLSMPAIYGALAVFPIAGIANRVHSKRAGLVSAWLIAFMPGHVSKSTFGLVDHDSFGILFLSTAFYFWITSLSQMNQERIFSKTSSNPLYMIAGIRESWTRYPHVMANATLSGIAFAIMALGWKGFVYGPAIIFLVFSYQILLNLFRSRDSLQLTSANLQMLFTTLIIILPYYAWPGLNLLSDPSGLQPLFYIIGFTMIVGWVSCSFRDKPWLLVLGVGTGLISFILGLLFLLQEANIYAGWDILFSGGFYFDKNKIFLTISEAQAPKRGTLFASYGPIVSLIALGCAFVFLWRGSRTDKSTLTLLGSWGIISAYMAWSAARFISNATPIIAILGGIGLVMLWNSANFSNFTKEWRNSGIGTPRARFRSLWPATKQQSGIPVLIIVFMLVFSQHITYGIDSGIPRGSQSEKDVDQAIYDITPDILRAKLLGQVSILDGSDYSSKELEYMGTFGPGFNPATWNSAFSWLSEQDADVSFSQRPAFVSWWDYGFAALTQGQHPTVSDNFQSGIPQSGGMLLSSGQSDTIALFIATLTQGDMKYHNGLGSEILDILSNNMNEIQQQEFSDIMNNKQSGFVLSHTIEVRTWRGVELLSGFPLDSNGIPSQDVHWSVISVDGALTSLGNESEAISLYNKEAKAQDSPDSRFTFSPLTSLAESSPSHYYIGDYKYAEDIISDFDSPSTSIHRTNSKLAMLRSFLVTAFDTEELVNLYHDLSSISYSIQDYDDSLGNLVDRNNEIRYFAVDNRLYPLGGSFYEDYSYHGGGATGIFHAPTGLSGLDMNDYITSLYQTQRGNGAIEPKTQAEFEASYLYDLELQQSGVITDPSMVIRYADIDYQHQDSFFDTMIARIYVGYGSSTLGLEGDAETPSVWVNPQATGVTGAPGSYLQNAWALPGAMMNHLVLSNWYDGDYDDDGINNSEDTVPCYDLLETTVLSNITVEDTRIILSDASLLPFSGRASLSDPSGNISVQWADKSGNTLTGVSGVSKNITKDSLLSYDTDPYCGTIYDSNYAVKMLKYYSGATLEGTVSLDGIGVVPNARILIERDAFSGEEVADDDGNVVDNDGRTYWIPIGFADADANGDFSFVVPAGKIRVSAFIGEVDLDSSRASIMTSDVGSSMYELTIEKNNQRTVNHITAILGNVSGATWLSETIVNVSGSQGHSNGADIVQVSIDVASSSASGILSWTGNGEFNGAPISEAQVILSPSSDIELDPYVASTSNGSVEGTDLSFQGTGEVVFNGQGSVKSDNVLSVSDFTGTHVQSIYNNHSISGDGLFNGEGHLSNGVINDVVTIDSCQNSALPEGANICSLDDDGEYLMDGAFNASGRFTSTGTSTFSRTLNQATLIGSGMFTTDVSETMDTYGTITGTGTFSGSGLFSGSMVQPGTFNVDGAIPGSYDISIIFEDGTVVDLDTNFDIMAQTSPMPFPVLVSGGSFTATLIDSSGLVVNSSISLVSTNSSEDILPTKDCSIVGYAPCLLYPDDQGKISFGPIIPGSYAADIDSDEDGIPELSVIYNFNANSVLDAVFPSPLPDKSDIIFTLLDGGQIVEGLNISFFSEDDSNNVVSALFNPESGEYNVELSPGTWILTHNLDNNKQIWKSIVVGQDDLSMDIEFEISKLITGVAKALILDVKEELTSPVLPNHLITFHWNDLSTTVYTGADGHFEVTLPVGVIVDASLEYALSSPYASNYRFTTSVDVDDNQSFELLAEEAVDISGTVNLDILGNYYDGNLGDWNAVTVIARQNPRDSSMPVWRAEVDKNGNFGMFIPEGNWSFIIDSDSLNSEESTFDINSTNKVVDLILYSVKSTVVIDFFIDHTGDGNISNGTMVQYPFAIKTTNPLIPTYSVGLNDSEWISQGRAEVMLTPGSYSIIVDRADSSAGDLFDTLYSSSDNIEIGLIPETISTLIAFEPEWLTNITFENQSISPLTDHLVRFKNVESGWLLSFITDSTGSISTYIPEGEWIVFIENFESSAGIFESLREPIEISNSSAGQNITLSTDEVASLYVVLSDEGTPLSDVRVELMSDAHGSISSPYSDETGRIDLKIEPGIWNIELNYTDANGVMWVLENTPLSSSALVGGNNSEILLNVSKFVLLKGTIFWDLNDNSAPNSGEGVSNVTVSLNSELQNETLNTDSEGIWSTYLPFGGIWNISTHIDGFSDENTSISLTSDSHVENIQITAGAVQVSGMISYIDATQFQQISDSISIILVPSEGIIRDRVVPNKVLDDQMIWNGQWDATVEPGDWVVWVTVDSSDDTPYLASIDSLVVGVEGGQIDSELSLGGKLFLDTAWLNFNGVSKTLLDLDSHNIILRLLSSKVSWDEELNSEGTLELILPTGSIDASTSFNFTHLDSGRVMDYSGGQGATIRPSQDTPMITLNIDRISNQDISISNSGDNQKTLEISDNCITNCSYDAIEFNLNLEYLGHQSFDTYSVSGVVPGADSENWLVEFMNNNGTWSTSSIIEMGLENSLYLDNFVVRITPANVSTAHHLINGHQIRILFTTEQGYTNEHVLAVSVPQTHLFSSEGFSEDIYGIVPGELLTIDINFMNEGNGDDIFTFNYDIDSLQEWAISGIQSQPAAPFIDGYTSVSIAVPINISDELYTLSMMVTDSTNNSYGPFDVLLQNASPVLSISETPIQLLSGNSGPISGQFETYLIQVNNDGLVDASSVELNGMLCSTIRCEDVSEITDNISIISGSDIRNVPAGGSVTFYVQMNFSSVPIDKYFIHFYFTDIPRDTSSIVSCNDLQDSTECTMEASVLTPSSDTDSSSMLGYIIGLLLVIVVLYIALRATRRPGAPF